MSVGPDRIRSMFSKAMSEMYKKEVPLYGELVRMVENVNRRAILEDPSLLPPTADAENDAKRRQSFGDNLLRLTQERHGAIRLGTPSELHDVRRLFAVMGMRPVGYYDLTVAGIPVHSTAFRPTDDASLSENPFRVFASLLRLDLIEDENLRNLASDLLDSREIFTEGCLDLIDKAERQQQQQEKQQQQPSSSSSSSSGTLLSEDDAVSFVNEAIETFRWHDTAAVDFSTYEKFRSSHALVADVVSFRGPHINHLTPRTLDIDAVQREMTNSNGIFDAKDRVEGPPPNRKIPLLLRQTSFRALSERVRFPPSPREDHEENDRKEAAVDGTHTARFGEVEQRGCALTREGRELYDRLLAKARDDGGRNGGGAGADNGYASRLQRVFREEFPDDVETLRKENLAYFSYRVVEGKENEFGKIAAAAGENEAEFFEDCVRSGIVVCDPLVYEDFLPISAAGIFESNLQQKKKQKGEKGKEQIDTNAGGGGKGGGSKAMFEEALGCPVCDEFELYESAQQRSIDRCKERLSELTTKASSAK